MGDRARVGGRYELAAAIGSGGFATVFRAKDLRSSAEVAVKLVPPGPDNGDLGARLEREASALRRVRSRFVARVYDLGTDGYGAWLVTELVDGVPLSPDGLGRALLPHEVLRVARGVLEGLSAAHEAGVVHGDVKPANVLVAGGLEGLDTPKLIDFGLALLSPRSRTQEGETVLLAPAVRAASGAQVARGPDEADVPSRAQAVIGTARYMAPEVLTGLAASPASDVYSAGVLLFELLGKGELFAGVDAPARLRARVDEEPSLEGRVPPPLSVILARMLARDPSARFPDATTALGAVSDLDTAPVAVITPRDTAPVITPRDAALPASAPETASSLPASAPESASSLPVSPPESASSLPLSAPPPSRTGFSSRPRPVARASAPPSSLQGPLSSRIPPSSRAPNVSMRPPSLVIAGPARLTTLPHDPEECLLETLRHLDLAMLDAFARRERATPMGRVARATSLALRLELDAAALILEPLAPQSPVARAVGAALVSPRSTRATSARVDADQDDGWVDALSSELAALFVVLAAALSRPEVARRDVARCARVIARLEVVETDDPDRAARVASLLASARFALAASRAKSGEVVGSDEELAPLPSESATQRARASAADRVARGLLAAYAAERIDRDRAREDLERAVRAANEGGGTLIEACAAVAWGRHLVSAPARHEQAIAALERARTLLAHGDAPGLEQEAEHLLAAAFAAQRESAMP